MHTPSIKRYTQQNKRLLTVDEVEQYFPGYIFHKFHIEQQMPRPVDKRRREAYYSGKKKRDILNKDTAC